MCPRPPFSLVKTVEPASIPHVLNVRRSSTSGTEPNLVDMAPGVCCAPLHQDGLWRAPDLFVRSAAKHAPSNLSSSNIPRLISPLAHPSLGRTCSGSVSSSQYLDRWPSCMFYGADYLERVEPSGTT
jgi:hypothetical protein